MKKPEAWHKTRLKLSKINLKLKAFRPELDIYMGPEGEVTVDDATVNLPYTKIWRSKQSVSIIKAGSSVSKIHQKITVSIYLKLFDEL